jgi:AraC-like DNA-binding protein/ligand-binding sensor protein
MKKKMLLSNLKKAADLFYALTGVWTLVIDTESQKLIEIPYNHLDDCFCKKITSLTGIETNFDHMYKTCEKSFNVNQQIIYKCPFGLCNIIVPIFDEGRLVAALQAGPYLDEKPEEILKMDIAPMLQLTKNDYYKLFRALKTFPMGDINQLIVFSEALRVIGNAEWDDCSVPVEQRAKFSNNVVCSNLITSIIRFVDKNYAENIKLNDAAKYAYVNPSHLSRVFNKEMNCSFRSYLNNIRIDKAKDLIESEDLTFVEISNQVGFTDQSYFNKIFKQITSQTPYQYKKSLSQKSASTQKNSSSFQVKPLLQDDCESQ